MLSKTQNKYIRSLWQQKFRNEYKVFIAEGTKIAEEWLRTGKPIEKIVGTAEWVKAHTSLIGAHPEAELITVTNDELAAVSTLQAPNQVLLVVKMPQPSPLPSINEWCLAVDNLRDPGNMGSMIRIADWFGIKHIVCSHDCAEVYNPKVVQSAMGGHLRVNIYETDLEAFLSTVKIPVLAAALDGENVYNIAIPKAAIIVIGNESKGISDPIQAIATQKILIPRRGGAESLNAAVSAGILCALLVR